MQRKNTSKVLETCSHISSVKRWRKLWVSLFPNYPNLKNIAEESTNLETHTHTLTNTHTLYLSLSHTHTHTHTHYLSLSHTHTHTQTHTRALSLCHKYTHTHIKSKLDTSRDFYFIFNSFKQLFVKEK